MATTIIILKDYRKKRNCWRLLEDFLLKHYRNFTSSKINERKLVKYYGEDCIPRIKKPWWRIKEKKIVSQAQLTFSQSWLSLKRPSLLKIMVIDIRCLWVLCFTYEHTLPVKYVLHLKFSVSDFIVSFLFKLIDKLLALGGETLFITLC